MSTESSDANLSSPVRFDGHKLSEFIYGTVTGMVAITSMGGSHEMNWLSAAAIVVFGAIAI